LPHSILTTPTNYTPDNSSGMTLSHYSTPGSRQERILVGIDANDYVGHPNITTYFGKIGMTEAILH